VATFRFFHEIEVRYGDLDPQGHVNNAKFLSYIEQARISYVIHLGLWEGSSFFDIGFILANASLTYHAPILFGRKVRVGVRVTHLGNKSLTMEYRIEDAQSGEDFATGSTVLVAYDYRSQTTIPMPDHWRSAIAEFEGLTADG
jgi:acyl-CoA thioester hydrolase